MGTVGDLASGFLVALEPVNLIYCFIGVFTGTLIGVLPGLGPAASIAILVPITYGIPVTGAIIMLAGIYYGAMYGGSTTAILLNIPGEAASVVTALDGYQLAKQGRAGAALGMAAISSFVAGTLGLCGLVLLAPPLADMALKVGPPDYFALVVFGLTVAVSLAGESLIKGLISGLAGLMLAVVGIDPQTGLGRLTFGSPHLMGGVEIVVAVVGLFGVSEVLANAECPVATVYATELKGLFPRWEDWKASAGALWRGSILGFVMGLVPGMVPAVITFVSYDLEKRVSKHPEKFGSGCIEGVAAPEGANNSATSGGLVPLFTLGLPTTPAYGVLIGALMLHGLQPGPLLFTQHKEFVWGVIASMYIGNLILLVLNLPLIPMWVSLLRIPYPLLASGVLAICFIGAYGARNNLFDVWVMLIFGALGYLMQKLRVPTIPLVIGLVLGDSMESSFRQSLAMSDGSLLIFLTKPMSLTLLLLATTSVALALYSRRRPRLGAAVAAPPEDL